jgi:lysylphosphatidylglycerol synthetase-like protein (DUF2156 family)
VTLAELAAAQSPAGARPAPIGEEAPAIGVLRRHGDHSSAFLTLNSGTQHYTLPGLDGFIAYRAGSRHVVQLCGPFAAANEREPLLASFLRWARSHRLRVTAVQLSAADAAIYARHNFVVNQFGCAYSIDLSAFTLRGTRFFKLRNKISRARRLGVCVEEATPGEEGEETGNQHQPAARDPYAMGSAELDAIDAAWLHAKGSHVKELAFMVGERAGSGAHLRRVFVARLDGSAVAYVTCSPCFGERPGWLYDLTRRHPEAPPGTIELIFSTVVSQLLDERCHWLHLGLTPMVGLEDEHELPGAGSALVRTTLRLLSEHGSAVYPANSQLAFKLKWAPQLIEPEYLAFQGGVSLGAVWQLLRVTRAI